MGALKKYDPKKVSVTFKGIPLNSGIVDGTFIEISRTERNSSLNTGADGGSTLVINNNRTTTCSLTLRMGSDTNDELTEIVLEDEADNDVKNVGVFQVKDLTGRSLHIDEEASLDGPPDTSYSTDEGEHGWTWNCPNMTMEPRGSNAALDSQPGFDGNV